MDNNGASVGSYSNFRILYLITQMVGVTIVVLVSSWIGVHLGGLGWTKPSIQFNWHPLLMSLGMIFLYGNCEFELVFLWTSVSYFFDFSAILVYRGFRYARKKPLKITHATIHGLAFLFTVVALIAVFDSHNLAKPPIPNMYSLHSWVGMAAVVLFSVSTTF